MSEEFDLEKHYFGSDRKLHRQERKRMGKKDRSKYKKTDLDKRQQVEINTSLPKGRILEIISEQIIVAYKERQYTCTLRGLLKKEQNRMRNLVAVGDFVRFRQEEAVIEQVEPRSSTLSRADPVSGQKEHVIVANVDQALIVVSVLNPALRTFLIDRYLIAANMGGMRPVIVINKIDLLDDLQFTEEERKKERALYEEALRAYEIAKIPLLSISLEKNRGLDALKEQMEAHTSVFTGQSGVGKSSLINCITGTTQAVGSLVHRTRKGMHTTSTSRLIPLENGGFCVDTPGIKSFALWELKNLRIDTFYSEIAAKATECRFSDCAHTMEPDCAVRDAVNTDAISLLRYESYLALLVESGQKYRPR